jgi:hypothetical protein
VGPIDWATPESDLFALQDGVELRAGKALGIVAQGTCRSLIIYRCEIGDQGIYVCDAHDAQTSASLKLQGEAWTEPGLLGRASRCEDLILHLCPPSGCMAPSPSLSKLGEARWEHCCASRHGRALLASSGRNVQIVKPLQDVEVMEKEGATFSCEVSHDEVPGQWFREASKLRPSDNVRIRQEGARAGRL